ncbi:MAG: hypothetical protein WBA10_15395 [Elainellaceae cyanobacterium]
MGHPVISCYFETINAGDYSDTAALFAADGEMRPPFETPIKQPDIANYLAKEASGMTLHPRHAEMLSGGDDTSSENPLDAYGISVSGYVQTPLFGVNVAWLFALQGDTIQAVRIKLLASPQELLKLR